jgi:hypothetical protein
VGQTRETAAAYVAASDTTGPHVGHKHLASRNVELSYNRQTHPSTALFGVLIQSKTRIADEGAGLGFGATSPSRPAARKT